MENGHTFHSRFSQNNLVGQVCPWIITSNESPVSSSQFVVTRYQLNSLIPESYCETKRRINFLSPVKTDINGNCRNIELNQQFHYQNTRLSLTEQVVCKNPKTPNAAHATYSHPVHAHQLLTHTPVQHMGNDETTEKLSDCNKENIRPIKRRKLTAVQLNDNKQLRRKRRNDSERLRIKRINEAFVVLESCLPESYRNTRRQMCQREVICAAIKYMEDLKVLLLSS